MTAGWKTVKLGELLSRTGEPVDADPSLEYSEITVRLWGKGVVERGRITGAQVNGRRFVARAGNFIASRIDARNGAMGLVPESLDGALVTNDFPLFQANKERLDLDYLGWLSKTAGFVELCLRASEGTTNRVRLKEERFLNLEIPLPPLAEQRRIVARIEALATQIEEARRLRKKAVEEAAALYESVLSAFCSGKVPLPSKEMESAQSLLGRISTMKFEGKVKARRRSPLKLPEPPEIPDNWMVVEAGELQEKGLILDIQDGNHGGDYPRKSEFSTDGVPFVTAKQFSNGVLRINDAPRLPEERAGRLRIGFATADDVFLTHNASVGDVALAPPDAGDFLLGTSATYWRCNPAGLERRYLYYFMLSDLFQGQLRFIMKQTTRNQVSVLKQVSLWICLPPLHLQRRIVAELDALQEQVNTLKHLQSETAAELDALHPAILDRAFKGEI